MQSRKQTNGHTTEASVTTNDRFRNLYRIHRSQTAITLLFHHYTVRTYLYNIIVQRKKQPKTEQQPSTTRILLSLALNTPARLLKTHTLSFPPNPLITDFNCTLFRRGERGWKPKPAASTVQMLIVQNAR